MNSTEQKKVPNEMSVRTVEAFLHAFQGTFCDALVEEDGTAFQSDSWQYAEGGGGVTRVLEGGPVFERAGVNFSSVTGMRLPAAATQSRRELEGTPFLAMGLSIVIHPRNPYVPISHANIRFFSTEHPQNPVWWFGGGFDLTPIYPFREDVLFWHAQAAQTCAPFGEGVYTRYKTWCDEYFYLKHRKETRGVGGLFFDDLNGLVPGWGFEKGFAFIQAVIACYARTYLSLVQKRRQLPYGQREKRFQAYRRGRYVEFNLVYDRGTLFGLQSGGRTESILMSLPPQAVWKYDWKPRANSPEADLESYLTPTDWF